MENLEKDPLDFIVESEVRGVNGLLTLSTTQLKIRNLVNTLINGDQINKSKIEKEFDTAKKIVKDKLSTNKAYDFNCVYNAVFERIFGFAKAVAETGHTNYYKFPLDKILEAYTIASIIIMEEYMKADTTLLDNQIYEFVIICAVNPLEEDILNTMLSLIS